MIPSAETLNTFAAAWAALLGGILWQSTVLALVVAAISLRLRHSSPGIRYWLWQIVALKLLILPLWTLAVPWPEFLGRSSSLNPAVLPNTLQRVPANFAARETAREGKPPDTLLIPHSSLAESRSLLGSCNELSLWSWLLLLWVLMVLG